MRQLLTIPKVTVATVLREYDAEDDDIRSVLVDLTDHWESQGARMVVHVPGRDLCTATDFAILLEQAPRALATLSRGQVFTISMYEQTAMLDLDLTPRGAQVRLTARAWGAAEPLRAALPSSVVVEDLKNAIATVDRAAAPVAPMVRGWIRAWQAGHVV